MDAPAFSWVSEQLEERSHFNRLQARGTVRLALKKGGLDTARVNGEEMALVLQRLMPQELSRRGIVDAEELCAQLATELATVKLPEARSGYETAEKVFGRVFGLDGDPKKR